MSFFKKKSMGFKKKKEKKNILRDVVVL